MFGHDAGGRLSVDRFEIGPAGDLFDVYRPAGASRQEGVTTWSYDNYLPRR
jgi:hypothetical protein